MKGARQRLDRLVGNVLWALDHALPATELIPMLEQLRAEAPPGSEAACLAKEHLASLVVAQHPWRAARLARELLADGESDTYWAILGLAHMLMGHYRSARLAYVNALAIAPHVASHQHNLGHLLDVAFDRPREAVPHLRRAHRALPDEPEVASSYAHALLRLGFVERARRILGQALESGEAAERVLASWQDPGTPEVGLEAAEA